MSSVRIHFNLHYEMISSETTCLFGVVLLVVIIVLLLVRTRSYRRSSRSQGAGKLYTKPVPEENEEKSCDQVRTVFIYNKMNWKFVKTFEVEGRVFNIFCIVVFAVILWRSLSSSSHGMMCTRAQVSEWAWVSERASERWVSVIKSVVHLKIKNC